MAEVHKKCHFSKQDWPSDDVGIKSPFIQKTKQQRKCATSIVERVVGCFLFAGLYTLHATRVHILYGARTRGGVLLVLIVAIFSKFLPAAAAAAAACLLSRLCCVCVHTRYTCLYFVCALAGGLATRLPHGPALAQGVQPRDTAERGFRHACEGVQDEGQCFGDDRRRHRVPNHGRCGQGES